MNYTDYLNKSELSGQELKYTTIKAVKGEYLAAAFGLGGIVASIVAGIFIYKAIPSLHIIWIILSCIGLFFFIVLFFEFVINRRKNTGWIVFEDEKIRVENLLREEVVSFSVEHIVFVSKKPGNDGGHSHSASRWKSEFATEKDAFALVLEFRFFSGDTLKLHVENEPFSTSYKVKLWEILNVINYASTENPEGKNSHSVTRVLEGMNNNRET